MHNPKNCEHPDLHASTYHSLPTTTTTPVSRLRHRGTPLSAKITYVSIFLLIITVAFSTWVNYYFSPKVTVTRELPNIAQKYYEDYYYDKLVGTISGTKSEFFERYTKKGLPTIRLRQLLLYDDNVKSEYSKIFNQAGCNQNTSTITYTPVSPYNKTDYTVKYNIHCKEDIEIK